MYLTMMTLYEANIQHTALELTPCALYTLLSPPPVRFELLDPALLRSGRFDRIVQCPLPDRERRNAILLVHTKKLKLAAEVDLDR